MTRARFACAALLVGGALVAAGRAEAQTKLAHVLPQFYLRGISAAAGTQPGLFVDYETSAVVATLNGSLAAQLATFPVGASSGGFTYRLDPSIGTLARSSRTFGPIFVERALTNGKGRLNTGVAFQSTSYDMLDGRRLDDGSFVAQLRHEDPGTDGTLSPYYEGDLVSTNLFMDLRLQTTAIFVSYGLGNRLDIGVVLPFVSTTLDAAVQADIVRLSTGSELSPPFTHQFDAAGSSRTVLSGGGQASGIGDVILRGKLNFYRKRANGLAVSLDVRLPTGDQEDLLGSGGTQARFLLVGSGEWGRFSPHFNLGFTASAGGSPTVGDIPAEVPAEIRSRLEDLPEMPHELNYALGFDAAPHRRVTLIFDLLGRTLLDAQRVDVSQQIFEYNVNPSTNPPQIVLAQGPVLTLREQNVNLLQGTAGLKINPGNSFLISVSGIWNVIDDSGLVSDFSAAVGVEYNY